MRWAGHATGARTVLMLAVFATVISAPVSAQGRKHALLVGVGDYIDDSVRDLEGPPHDVRSLEQVLRRDWQFDEVTALVDRDATRAAILDALDQLIRYTRPQDQVFIFFSGHGTSSYEGSDLGRAPSALAATLDPGTGGLLPADIDLRSPDAADVLLIGRRDLRPRFQVLSRDRDVFVVFDACYSGNTVRQWSPQGEPVPTKYQPWPTATSVPRSSTRSVDAHYPYDNLVYLSASAENEVAFDIPQARLQNMPTIDNRPHGVLTDAILRGLAGAGDTNGNGELTVGELHRYVRKFVESRKQQTPQLLHPPGQSAATERLVFGAGRAADMPPVDVTPPVPSALRVRLGGGAAGLREQIAALDGVTVVAGAYDLHIDSLDGRSFTIRHGSGDVLASAVDDGEALERAAWQASVQRLLGESFPGQDFNLVLEVVDVALENGRPEVSARTNAELFVGDAYEMRYSADVPAYFLLLTVDVHGAMRLLVPWTSADLHAMRDGRIPDLRIVPPTGTEFVKLFAFRERPAEFESWLPERGPDGRPRVRSLDSEHELDSLLRFVRAQGDGTGETSRKFVTAIRAR